MLKSAYGPGQRADLVQMLKRSVSYVTTLFLVLVLGNDGLLLWQQGCVLLEGMSVLGHTLSNGVLHGGRAARTMLRWVNRVCF